MKRAETIDFLSEHNQRRIIQHYQRLSPDKQNLFRRNLEGLDLPLIFKLHQEFSGKNTAALVPVDIQPAPIITVPKTPSELVFQEKACVEGEALLRENRVAVLVVAGGQGSRFGFEGPKGIFPVSPVKKKSLFQLFSETVSALNCRYRAAIPLLIMTSRENDGTVKDFFRANHFFGLDSGAVFFFTQEMLPTITADGNLILKDETHLFANPDGHGGSLKALHKSGLLSELVQKGFSDLFYGQVDNPLVKIADPVFLGYHRMAESEFSLKVLRRRNAAEKIGVYALLDGKPGVIEYSDLAPGSDCLSGGEDMRFWAGSIAIHILSLSFVERLNCQGFSLPYHRAVKVVEAPGQDGKAEKATVWKFETFVFDGLPLAARTCCVETFREEEFAPVKNRQGEDSADTARKAISDRFRRWLVEAGSAVVAPGVPVEISPRYALDPAELAEKLKGKTLVIKEDTYLE
ncbi:MAG: UTP--glucose-1-phosphate uridylyltransferase [Candidatus Omnitrophota bacterium]|nr:UTP--glucose-1-phosphate uridylyltransferase [Candidatus Omnitrophota bacterium]